MSHDPFTSAGEQFRKGAVRDTASRDRSIAELLELATFCAAGVQGFYGGKSSDVYVERIGDAQVSIRFGYRPGKFCRVLTGPFATLFVTPEGKILWACLTRWVEPDATDPPMQAETLDPPDYRASLTPKLIAFLQAAEREYRNCVA